MIEVLTLSTMRGQSRDGGIHSHGRSLLVWPDDLTSGNRAQLEMAAPLGVRIVVLGDPTSLAIPGIEASALHLFTTAGQRAGRVTEATRLDERDIAIVQSLQRACGLTPLPRSSLTSTDQWVHACRRIDGEIVAFASAQHMPLPLPSERASDVLVCAVAVHPDVRGEGLGRQVVGDVLAQHANRAAGALVQAGDANASRFFELMGWHDEGVRAHVLRWD